MLYKLNILFVNKYCRGVSPQGEGDEHVSLTNIFTKCKVARVRGESGFDGLILVINKKSKEGVRSIFLFQN